MWASPARFRFIAQTALRKKPEPVNALAFRNLLEAGDVEGCRAYWAAHAPHLPQAESAEQAETVMHIARTASDSVSFRLRAYSHRWLIERDLGSQLPDQLRPAADRLHPERAVAVAISVNFRSPYMKGAESQVRGAMEAAVLEADADGRIEDAAFVSARMSAAKSKAMRVLFGG